METEKIEMICKHCKSDDVVMDAWAIWDDLIQEWVLDNVFDDAFCKNCDGETSLEEKHIQ